MFIDGVFSGGGIKAFALVGAFEEIEKKGIRFKRVAGTSAGSIIAALISAGYSSKEIFTCIDELDVSEFLDVRNPWLPMPITKWILMYWHLGLYKGNKLEQWIADKLSQKGLKTFADLPLDTLRVIASDLTNGRLLVLPDDLEDYGIQPLSFPIAKAIRMSCSLPYFFEPVKLRSRKGTSIIVDGGVLSNFPMWLFDTKNTKKIRPVIGIKLSHKMSEFKQNDIKNAVKLFSALFETMKNAHDARYISRRHEKDIIFIPTEGVLTTEFHLTNEKKHELLKIGREHAAHFFRTWSY
ncbi:patatin-like phospholipase family protein [Bacillus aquiflavi]|uniref:Patatin-like phospholipase family protein n=1 Tax=Bacillus aquiflavi TaxID=2672567 RepID=A0A6B3VXA6_9BACI|nr:patatin-like phospholipase family protein [Bacillus aquiflavi]MBA4535790.1 patatin-like phospholipase family protein [Bacillus aquiflavi]NEY80166.1 patatin-like phospholipase family protein [Bacillus aquiflavi]UAC47218.1 patatin-like phospholipase family protein [Bacillus aquiflavi]